MARKRETQKVSTTTTTTTNGNTYHFPSPDFGALSGGDTISPIITGQSPRLRPSSFDLSNGRERGLSSSALSIGSTDSSSFNLDSNRLLEMNNLPGDAGDKDLVSDLYVCSSAKRENLNQINLSLLSREYQFQSNHYQFQSNHFLFVITRISIETRQLEHQRSNTGTIKSCLRRHVRMLQCNRQI